MYQFNNYVFLFLYLVWGSKSVSIFFNSDVFGSIVNLVGAFGRFKFKISIVFKSDRKNKQKIKKKREFLRKTQFLNHSWVLLETF